LENISIFIFMRCKGLKIVIVVSLISVAMGDWFSVQLGVQNSDITLLDWYSYFGIMPDASNEWDYHDGFNMDYTIEPYIDLFFPHDDPDRPQYWEPPRNDRYALDYRSDDFDEHIFYFDIFSTSGIVENVAIFWFEEVPVPPSYLIEIAPLHENGVNIFTQDTLREVLPPGISYFTITIKKDAYEKLEIKPDIIFLRIGERIWADAMLVGFEDSVKISPEWEIYGESAILDGDAIVGVAEGVSIIESGFKGWCDSTIVIVSTGGITAQIPIKTGWNLISLPTMPSNRAASHIFGDLFSYVYEYDEIETNFFTPESIKAGEGYFVLTFVDTVLEFVGEPVLSIEIDAVEGWNVIGAPVFPINWDEIISDIPDVYFSDLFSLDESIYFCEDTLNPKYGYWVFSSEETIISTSP